MKANQKTLHRQIRSQFDGKRQIPFTATHHEIGHGREISWAVRAKEAREYIKAAWPGTAWMVELVASGTREGKPFMARHLFLTSLRTCPEALLRLIRERWSIESWHWIRDTQLHGRQQGGLIRMPGAERLGLLHAPFSHADPLQSLGSGRI